MPSPIKVIVVGAGSRGETYSDFASIHPDRLQVVGIADPRLFARKKLQECHNVPEENVFDDWHCVAEREKFADAVFICTPDRLHKEPAVALARKGYHILLEKPMAVTLEDCTEIAETCIQSGVILAVCHVLQYDPFIRKIKVLIDSGVIGDVIHIQHFEPVGFYHFAHSFVRGNWRNEAESSFALLAKSCHDLDLINHWAGKRRCIKVSSFGSLNHFQKENKPPGAASRCLDCSVETDCAYSAKKIYLDRVKKGWVRWPVSVVCRNSIPDIESVTEALKTGPYGRCVYECDNDVCSNQVVNMEFEGGLTASFSMVAFTEEICLRKTSIQGSKGELTYDGHEIKVFDFLTQISTKHTVDLSVPGSFSKGGHGIADYHLVDAFVSAVANGNPLMIQSGPKETLASHRLVFEAECSRLENRVVMCATDHD
ncbi:uncharacterized protein zgc:154075 [Ictalurus furcatus]|uniref:uncharacterized protein zgc:154075 n=1 Tax=Ictalurus furcatus TaxID=66913 RepID=UPI0023510221|nr:uncharacterized protein zgc:154075 [Ictalurus furcatus]XP_053499330.1 uncharacterized protein zgc:154075 [Ictalurus furcatus]XP_053499331.1 uncharacterized protein zgc:154075 [Ictalurus furcatus]